MPGHGPAPKPPDERTNHHAPLRGEWQDAPGAGWRHGEVPPPPPGVLEVTVRVWGVWFSSWFAAHWDPSDLPGLYIVAKLYDAVMQGELVRTPELRIQMDAFGMTPKGQQDRRWKRPVRDTPADSGGDSPAPGIDESPGQSTGHYGHLRSAPPAASAAS